MKPVIYTRSTGCSACEMLVEYLDDKKVEYTRYDVDKDDEALQELMSRGIHSVPVLVVGDEAVAGFNPHETDRLLESLNGRT